MKELIKGSFAEFIKDVADQFFNRMLHLNVKLQTNDASPEIEFKDFEHAVFVSVLGGVEGVMVIKLSSDIVKWFILKIENREVDSAELLSEEIKGYLGEFANVLMGKLVPAFCKTKVEVMATTPSYVSGSGMAFSLPYDNVKSCFLTIDSSQIHLLFYYDFRDEDMDCQDKENN